MCVLCVVCVIANRRGMYFREWIVELNGAENAQSDHNTRFLRSLCLWNSRLLLKFKKNHNNNKWSIVLNDSGGLKHWLKSIQNVAISDDWWRRSPFIFFFILDSDHFLYIVVYCRRRLGRMSTEFIDSVLIFLLLSWSIFSGYWICSLLYFTRKNYYEWTKRKRS